MTYKSMVYSTQTYGFTSPKERVLIPLIAQWPIFIVDSFLLTTFRTILSWKIGGFFQNTSKPHFFSLNPYVSTVLLSEVSF